MLGVGLDEDAAHFAGNGLPRHHQDLGSAFARLLLDRARDLIIHGSAHRGANGVAMPTDEDDQDGHFFYNRPERGAYFAA